MEMGKIKEKGIMRLREAFLILFNDGRFFHTFFNTQCPL